jgi:hypothetical protein
MSDLEQVYVVIAHEGSSGGSLSPVRAVFAAAWDAIQYAKSAVPDLQNRQLPDESIAQGIVYVGETHLAHVQVRRIAVS